MGGETLNSTTQSYFSLSKKLQKKYLINDGLVLFFSFRVDTVIKEFKNGRATGTTYYYVGSVFRLTREQNKEQWAKKN